MHEVARPCGQRWAWTDMLVILNLHRQTMVPVGINQRIYVLTSHLRSELSF